RSIAQYASFQKHHLLSRFLKQNDNKQRQIESLTSIVMVHHNKLNRGCVFPNPNTWIVEAMNREISRIPKGGKVNKPLDNEERSFNVLATLQSNQSDENGMKK
ncbi:hypothetical protein V8G54_010241, partial [Vigna mungo]